MPDFSKVTEWTVYLSQYNTSHKETKLLLKEAQDYLLFYNWCSGINKTYIGMFYEGILGIFLFEIVTSREDVDKWIWVVVGDLPSAYITIDECPNPATVLDGYVGAMQKWVDAAICGKSVANLIPVNVPATKENGDMLKIRLEFIDNKILPQYKSDLNAQPIRKVHEQSS